MGTPVPSIATYSLSGSGPAGGSRASRAGRIGGGLGLDDRGGGLPVGLGAPPGPLAGQLHPASSLQQRAGRGERHRRGRPRGHLPQPRRHALPGDAELLIAGRQPVTALPAVIPGPPDGHRAEHRVHALVPVAGQLRLVAAPHATRGPA